MAAKARKGTYLFGQLQIEDGCKEEDEDCRRKDLNLIQRKKVTDTGGSFAVYSRKELLKNLVCVIIFFVAGVVLSWWIREDYSRRSHAFRSETLIPAVGESCSAEEDSSFKYFLHPRQVVHNMTDKELLWRASMVPMVNKYPFKRVPKVAFLFLTRGPLPLSPLWDRFFKGHSKLYSIYIHTNPGHRLNVPENSAFYGRQIPSEEAKWGSVTLLDAERRLLSNALLDFSNERFVLLSESCIPVFNFQTVYSYLLNSSTSYVQSYDDHSHRGRGRYSQRMEPDIKIWQWRKGSQWFELRRELAAAVVADTKYYPIFRQHCKPSCFPDEHYLATYLSMFHGKNIANTSVTFVDWSKIGPHPASFRSGNITEEFIQFIRGNGSTTCTSNSSLQNISTRTKICYLFARKFSPSALRPLLKLAKDVMNF